VNTSVIAGLDPAIHHLDQSVFLMDARVTWREDARSLSSGGALRRPVGLE
jgi:hypothetical protein